jgi:hypothetical protein
MSRIGAARGVHAAGAHQEVDHAVRRAAAEAAGRAHRAGDEDADALVGHQHGVDLHLVGVDAPHLGLDHALHVARAGAGEADRADIGQEQIARGVHHAHRIASIAPQTRTETRSPGVIT